jgi:soluble lytic murein transglycosylase
MFQHRQWSPGRRIWAVAAMVLIPFCGARAVPEDDLLAARDAYNARNAARLAQYAQRLQGNPLEAFPRYWQLSLKLEETSPEEVREYLAAFNDSFLSDRLRGDWLRVLGKQQNWALFSAEYPLLVNEAPDITCYALQARRALFPADNSALTEARRMWFSGEDLPSSCDPLFEQLVQNEILFADDVFARLRLALEAGNISVARRVTQYLPAKYQDDLKPLESVADNPQRYLERKTPDLSRRGAAELVLFAIHRLARTDHMLAASHWEKLREHFSPADQAYEWGQLAYQAARKHDPIAVTWFTRAQGAPLSDLQGAWKARAALRAQQWPMVAEAIDGMSPQEQRQAMWRYWKARSLKATGKNSAALEMFAVLSREYNYYGQLSLEELGAVIAPSPATYKASEAEVKLMASVPGLQRALGLYRANLRGDGAREWLWNIRKFDDKELLAAAELARRNDLYDRAISTADRTQQLHDFELRFPAPHRDVMQVYTQQTDLDDAWVYGLIRQESRFVQLAKSNVGASGLMQLMPATAKWVARKMGLKNFKPGLVNELDTNIALGTYYLKHVYDSLDGSPVLATAAYNAGPGRARRWQADYPMEGTIYIENIPFNETRDYVKKVMSNTVYYAMRFGEKLTSLRQRVGTIGGKKSRSDNEFSGEP